MPPAAVENAKVAALLGTCVAYHFPLFARVEIATVTGFSGNLVQMLLGITNLLRAIRKCKMRYKS